MYKIRLQRHFFKTCNKWAKWQVDIRSLSTKGCLPLPRGNMHVEKKTFKNVYKIRIQRDFLKLATNGRSGKSFLLTSKFWPQGFVCPCPGAIYMYKIIKKKNVYTIRIQRDHFETCNKWSNNLGFLLTSKLCHQGVFCSWLVAIYMHENIKKMCIKSSDSKWFFKNLQQMVKMIRSFCWDQNFDPKGLSALAPGLLHV